MLDVSSSPFDPKQSDMGRFVDASGEGHKCPRSVTLDNALTACGLEATAELVGLTGRGERPRHDAVINPLGAKISASNDGGPTSELARELLLQRAEGRLRIGFAPLRRNLPDIPASCSIRCDGWRWRRGRAWRGRRDGTLRW